MASFETRDSPEEDIALVALVQYEFIASVSPSRMYHPINPSASSSEVGITSHFVKAIAKELFSGTCGKSELTGRINH